MRIFYLDKQSKRDANEAKIHSDMLNLKATEPLGVDDCGIGVVEDNPGLGLGEGILGLGVTRSP